MSRTGRLALPLYVSEMDGCWRYATGRSINGPYIVRESHPGVQKVFLMLGKQPENCCKAFSSSELGKHCLNIVDSVNTKAVLPEIHLLAYASPGVLC